MNAPELHGLEAWAAWLGERELPVLARTLVESEAAERNCDKVSAAQVAEIVLHDPLATLKAWEAFHVADQASPYLSKRFVDSRFTFTKTLSGVSTLRPRWRRGRFRRGRMLRDVGGDVGRGAHWKRILGSTMT